MHADRIYQKGDGVYLPRRHCTAQTPIIVGTVTFSDVYARHAEVRLGKSHGSPVELISFEELDDAIRRVARLTEE